MRNVKFKLISLMIGCFIFANNYTADNDYLSPLIAAVQQTDNNKIVELLLQAGVNLNIQYKEPNEKLHDAIRYGDLEKVKDLVENQNLDVNMQVLLTATHMGDTEIIDYLIEHRSHDIDLNTLLSKMMSVAEKPEIIKFIESKLKKYHQYLDMINKTHKIQ